jgi:hypothetical protein
MGVTLVISLASAPKAGPRHPFGRIDLLIGQIGDVLA